MRKVLSLCVFVVLSSLGLAGSVLAQAAAPGARAPEAKPDEKCDAAATKEESSATDHSIRVGGQTISYKATASTTLLKNDKGEPTGLLYSVAYTKNDVKDPSTRPVSFLYNGGPGPAPPWPHHGAALPPPP